MNIPNKKEVEELEIYTRKLALSKILECDEDKISEDCFYTYCIGEQEYLVLTDEEAQERVYEEIRESLWAFNSSFICKYIRDYSGNTDAMGKAISIVSENLCENANPLIINLIGENLDDFIDEAIALDGRGHFLSHYDGAEEEYGNYFIYRIN